MESISVATAGALIVLCEILILAPPKPPLSATTSTCIVGHVPIENGKSDTLREHLDRGACAIHTSVNSREQSAIRSVDLEGYQTTPPCQRANAREDEARAVDESILARLRVDLKRNPTGLVLQAKIKWRLLADLGDKGVVVPDLKIGRKAVVPG